MINSPSIFYKPLFIIKNKKAPTPKWMPTELLLFASQREVPLLLADRGGIFLCFVSTPTSYFPQSTSPQNPQSPSASYI